MSTVVRSFAKVNLGLAVGPARADGFHGLVTLYQTVALHDRVRVEARVRAGGRSEIVLEANHPGVPRTQTGDAEKNTMYRMVAGALERMGVAAEVRIQLDKRLPVQGGMGAGSANAVAALLGLERELGMAPPGAERMRLAAEVGSDVPLFLLGGTVLGIGRGEQVYPMADLPAMACVVAVPEVGVSTALAFRELDARMAMSGGGLTSVPQRDRLEELSRVLSSAWAPTGVGSGSGEEPGGALRGTTGIADTPDTAGQGWGQAGDLAENPLLALVRTGIENDFEEVAFSQHPFLRSLKRALAGEAGQSAVYAALSGSGSALFGLYRSLEDARAAQQRVARAGVKALVTETLPRAAYWSRMFPDAGGGSGAASA